MMRSFISGRRLLPKTSSELSNLQVVASARLREAGYELVEHEVPVRVGRRNRIFDLIAYARGEDGEIRPTAVVEVKQRLDRQAAISHALTQLALARELLGVQDYYGYDGRWYEPDPSFAELRSVSGPARLTLAGMESDERPAAQTHDVDLVLRALEHWIQSRTGPEGSLRPVSHLEVIADALDELLLGGLDAVRGLLDGVWVPTEILWRAARRLVEGAARTHVDGRELIVPNDVRRVLVNLARPGQMFALQEDSSAGGTVADPFCGLGLLLCDLVDALWESKLQPQSRHAALLIYGADPNPLCVRIATALLRLAPSIQGFKTMVDVEVADGAMDGRRMAVRVLISAPPFGRKLPVAVPTRAGSTRNGDVAQIERCTRSIREGGLAVVLTSQGWLFRTEAMDFRHALATDMDVVAVIGLPPRAVGPSTAIASAVTVIRRAEPSDSLVADLEEDWREQLSASGNFFQSYLARLTDEG
jgi:hypothetical protein